MLGSGLGLGSGSGLALALTLTGPNPAPNLQLRLGARARVLLRKARELDVELARGRRVGLLRHFPRAALEQPLLDELLVCTRGVMYELALPYYLATEEVSHVLRPRAPVDGGNRVGQLC